MTIGDKVVCVDKAELPAVDGYYWMRNIVDEGREIWRIVNVFSSGHPDRNGMQRIARDYCSIFTNEELADWKGVEFHGPIHPPSKPVELEVAR